MLILDYDGTLTPIVADPAAARLAAATRAVLGRLARHGGVRLVVLSGRSLADLRHRVGVPGAVYGGCHGLEIAGRGLRFVHPGARAGAGAVRRAARALGRGARTIPGALVEDKRFAVSLHYRRVPRARRPAALALAAAVRRSVPGLAVIVGKDVHEFLPRIGWDKGRAARWIVRRLRPTLPAAARPPLLVFAGDDTTDEAAFAALRPRGVTVRVGARPGGAAYRVGDAGTLRAVLRRIERLLDRGRGGPC